MGIVRQSEKAIYLTRFVSLWQASSVGNVRDEPQYNGNIKHCQSLCSIFIVKIKWPQLDTDVCFGTDFWYVPE